MINLRKSKPKNRMFIILIILILFLNCKAESKSTVYDFIDDGVDIDITNSDNIEKELIEEFGIPISFEEEIKESQQLNKKSIFKKIKFNGIIFELKNSKSPIKERESIQGITVYDNKVILKHGLKVGDNMNTIRKRFGKPNFKEFINDLENGGEIEGWVYSNSNRSVTFYSKNETVVKIIWKYNLI